MYTGIDIGYNATKAVTERRRTTFLSVVGTPDRANFALNGNSEAALVLVTPTHALIGEEAVNQSRFLNRREDRRWIESAEWLTLFHAALTELTSATAVDIELVTGLPVAFYSDKAQVQERLLGEHRVQREGRRAQLLRVAKFSEGMIALVAPNEANVDMRARNKDLRYVFKAPSALKQIHARVVGVDILGYVNDPGFTP